MNRTVLFAITLGSLATTARAYVPPSFYVVRSLARKHNNIDQTRIVSKVTLFKGNGEFAKSFVETVSIIDADHVQVRLANEVGSEITTRTRKLTTSRPGDLERPVTYDLLVFKDGNNIFEHFKALGLPLKTEAELYSEKEGSLPYKPETTVAFARHENKVAIVVGENSPRSIQLWVEKDSFLPLKALFPTTPQMGLSSEPLEFRFAGYQAYKNFLYPKAVQILRNGNSWLKLETLDVRPGAGGPLEPARAKAESDAETKDFIEKYFRWIR